MSPAIKHPDDPISMGIHEALGIDPLTTVREIFHNSPSNKINYQITGRAKTGRSFNMRVEIHDASINIGYREYDPHDPKNDFGADSILRHFCTYISNHHHDNMVRWFPNDEKGLPRSDKPRIIQLGKWDISVNYTIVSEVIGGTFEVSRRFTYSWKEGKRGKKEAPGTPD